MQHKKIVACASAAVLALAMACSKHSTTPVSPTSALPGTGDAAPDGSTLKVSAPTPQSPINGQQPDTLVLTASTSSAQFTATPALSYEFEIYNSANTRVYRGVQGSTSGGSVSHVPTGQLDFDQPHTWRVRATYAGAVGPWSSAASFRSPSGGYIRDNEVFDPLTNGKTAGDLSGPTQFIPGQGLKLLDHTSFVTYRLPVNLQAGEFSMMILGADEGSEGDKSKVFSMQEGPDINDITTDDYRFTAELRARNYGTPGSVTYRIISGDGVSRDGARFAYNFDSSRWYFWRFTWQTGSARLEVKEDGPNGRTMYSSGVGGWSHPYRPDPHYLHLGAPAGRAGLLDATLPGGIYKNVWASSRPRPAFPGE
jgi:hypothetical protein